MEKNINLASEKRAVTVRKKQMNILWNLHKNDITFLDGKVGTGITLKVLMDE